MIKSRAGIPAAFILVGLLGAACVTTAPAATAPAATAPSASATPAASATVAASATAAAVPPTSAPARTRRPGRTSAPTAPPTPTPTDAPTDAPTDTPTEGTTAAPTEPPAPEPTDDTWAITAITQRGNDGQQYTIECAPGGTPRTIWGTLTFTDDSSICTAAVHAGFITVAAGGSVTYEIAPGQEFYVGSEANGITSRDYASWGGSFSPVAP